MAGDKKKKVVKGNNTNKKVTKVTETQFHKIAEEAKEQTVNEQVDVEKFKDEKGEYDLTNATETEVKNVFNQLKDDDEVFVTKKKEVEVVNGDPAVLTPKEEIPTPDEAIEDAVANTIEEIVEAPVKETKKIIKKVEKYFGYLWNGQAIDF